MLRQRIRRQAIEMNGPILFPGPEKDPSAFGIGHCGIGFPKASGKSALRRFELPIGILPGLSGLEYLVQSQQGKPRQICVPKAWQERVRQAVNDYQQMQRLIEEVSELEWKRLRERKP